MFEDGTIIKEFDELFIERLNYIIYVVLLLIGLHGMIAKNNLIKKLIGMSIFQTAIILFYVSVGVKEGATIPIYLPEHDPHGSHASHGDENGTDEAGHGPVVLEAGLVEGYANPLPHVLMLTAIVVGVATLGLALALCLRIYQGYGTIEEDEILAKIERQEMRSKPSIVGKSADSSKAAVSKSKSTGSKKSPAKPKTAASKSIPKAKPKPRAKPKAKPSARAKATPPAQKAKASKPKPRTPKK
jgi:multicomponent Na+:H+ antiporter subunit C